MKKYDVLLYVNVGYVTYISIVHRNICHVPIGVAVTDKVAVSLSRIVAR